MPESLYKEFSPQQLRDLFSFLQSEPQPGRQGTTMNVIRYECWFVSLRWRV